MSYGLGIEGVGGMKRADKGYSAVQKALNNRTLG
jgi:hypothetical protein